MGTGYWHGQPIAHELPADNQSLMRIWAFPSMTTLLVACRITEHNDGPPLPAVSTIATPTVTE